MKNEEPNFTKTTRRDLSGNNVVLKARLQRLKNDELNIIQLIESISVNDEEAVREHDLFLDAARRVRDEVLSKNLFYFFT